MKDLLERYEKVCKVKDICNELSNNITKLRSLGNSVELITEEEQKILLNIQDKIEIIGARANTKQLEIKRNK